MKNKVKRGVLLRGKGRYRNAKWKRERGGFEKKGREDMRHDSTSC